MKHTEACIKQFAAAEAAIAEWKAQWPHHCPACNGWGAETTDFDPSPAGVSLGAGFMVDVAVCEACWEHGVCPRCRTQAWDPEDVGDTCKHCGWTDKDGGCPPAPECVCWTDEEF